MPFTYLDLPHANRWDLPRLKRYLPWLWETGSLETSMPDHLHTRNVRSCSQPWSRFLDYIVTHEVYQVQSATKGLYVDLDMSPTSSSSRHIRFQVDPGCSCNKIHLNDLKQLPNVQITPSMVRLLDYSKSIIPIREQVTMHCTRRGIPYDIVAQVNTAKQSTILCSTIGPFLPPAHS